jgi:hypothetical protein
MKLDTNARLPTSNDVQALKTRLYDLFRDVTRQINGLSEGSIDALHLAYTAAPTTGTWKQGDFIPNLTPTELGTAGNKYTVSGWRCVASGTPGTWVQCRDLTGN